MNGPAGPNSFDGQLLNREEYLADFAARFESNSWRRVWKLERRQSFRELNNPSWEASAAGDWQRAIILLDLNRPNLERDVRTFIDREIDLRRVRVVQKPLSRYLVWELTSLMIRYEYGCRVRVVTTDQVREAERRGALPEIITFDSDLAYEVIYDQSGLAVGAVRCTEPCAVNYWAGVAHGLYDIGEELPDFFGRELDGRQEVLLAASEG